MGTWIDVAVLVKTKSLQGRFVARSAGDLPFLLHEGQEVAFVPPVIDAPRRARVLSVADRGDGRHEVAFDTVTDADTANRLNGCHCLVRGDGLHGEEPAPEGGDVVGWRVHDVNAGYLGTITEVIENPGQSLLSIARVEGGRPLLIPLVDEFVTGLDEDACRVNVHVPVGLLEL